jgi:hypothetical protein
MGIAEFLLIALGLYVIVPKLIFMVNYMLKIASFKLTKTTLL